MRCIHELGFVLRFDFNVTDISVVPPIPKMVDDPSVLAQGALELNEEEIDEGSMAPAVSDNNSKQYNQNGIHHQFASVSLISNKLQSLH